MAHYEWQGVVLSRSAHFWVVWKLNADLLLLHDGLKGSKVQSLTWAEFAGAQCGCAMLIYTLIKDEEVHT